MVHLKNVKFLIRLKHSPIHSVRFWSKYTKNIDIPENIYNEYCKCCTIKERNIDIISAYLLGWFYNHNEHLIHLDNIEEVYVSDWDWDD